jgi:hypothetical protein
MRAPRSLRAPNRALRSCHRITRGKTRDFPRSQLRYFPLVKANIPDDLKADLPPSKWGKILSATPVVLAVVSTLLAGLASSEMTKAQYDRSLAAQLQSKAGDQWSFFQAKRLRGALQNTTLDVILSSTGRGKLEREALLAALRGTPAAAALDKSGESLFAVLRDGSLPKPAATPSVDANVKAALEALETSRPENELVALLAKVDDKVLEDAVRAAREHALSLDVVLKPINQNIEAIEQQMDRPQIESATRRDFVAARLEYNARRYDAEARLNQVVANLYELQVRKANLSAARHHRRSQRFFYGMLAAQTGVIISTLAIAARKRNLLWTIAAIAGVAAIAFAAYVYVFV